MESFTAGQWLLFEHGDPIGYERWKVTPGADGALLLESEGGATFPRPHESRVRLELAADARVLGLRIDTRVEGDEDARTLQARRVEEEFLLFERTVEGHSEDELVPLEEGVLVDYTSPLFTTGMLRALALDVGDAREVAAVLVNPLDFRLARQRYGFRRLEDAEVTVPAGTFPVRTYEFASMGTRYKGRVWTDAADNVVKDEDSWALLTTE